MTGMDVFERALDLCALRGTGADDLPTDLEDLRLRSLGLINLLLSELRPLDERLTGEKRRIQEMNSLHETVDLCEGISMGLLPYALAAMLIAEEDPDLYGVLTARVQEVRRSLLADGKTRRHGIVEVYG